ncbi:HEAT repeat domain-containing protein [Candidatus Uabimicrobium amorphum]|uniref:HEAT repeat domain-containing protein n=1 Tax=Uabimicrobium amorphum TaxID=2596890 RepID=A0A5S9IU25_UABAM|nr:HEAT repeat domain-containing protein [Candidatus Uabimicrobium amorphum]BBM88109.1 hypothetical protein UABAM_06525 [Candidatus Uabimicrobium amorphum]
MKNIQILLMIVFSTACIFAQQQGKNDWLVEVKLKNGSSIKGVARNAIFLEKQSYGAYVVLKNQNRKIVNDLMKKKSRSIRSSKRNLGIRLWYVKNSPGHLYIPYGDVKMIIVIQRGYDARDKVVKKLSEVAKDYRDVQVERREKRKELAKQRKVEAEQQAERDRVAAEERLKQELTLTQEEEQLLADYPPNAKWNEEEYHSLRRQLNRARNNFSRTGNGGIAKTFFGGVNKKERTFVKNFKTWKVAVEKAAKIREAEAKAEREQKKSAKESSDEVKDDRVPTAEKNQEKPEAEGPKKEEVDFSKAIRKNEKPQRQFSSIQEINHVLYGKDPRLRIRAIKRLGMMKEKNAVSALVSVAGDNKESREMRVAAISSLGKIYSGEESIINVFKRRLRSQSREMRSAVINASFSTEEDLSPMEDMIGIATLDNNKDIRYRAVLLIEKQKFMGSIGRVQERLRDSVPQVKIAAIYALLKLDPTPRTLNVLQRYKKYLNTNLERTKDEELKSLITKTLRLLN